MVQNGTLLIAEPFLEDPYFKQAVIMVCDHHKDGTLGFILNKPLELGVNDLLPDFPEMESNVYFGGPVERESTLHFLHNVGDLLEGSARVMNGVWWGGDFTKLKFLIENELIKPNNIRFYLGYTGWEAGQLSGELVEKTWITSESDPNYPFMPNPSGLWEKVLNLKGDQFAILSELPKNTNLN